MRCPAPPNKTALLGIAAGLLLTLAVPGLAQAGSCLVAEVPSPVVLPDGSLHPAGSLRLCFDRSLNPAVEFQEISMAGQSAGLFRGETFRPEQNTTRFPMVHFHESVQGEWILIGFSRPATQRHADAIGIRLADPEQVERLIAHRDDALSGASTVTAADRGTGPQVASVSADRTILLAAR